MEMKHPITIGGKTYSAFECKPISFSKFNEIARKAVAEADDKTGYAVLLRRQRLELQIVLTDGEKPVSLTQSDIATLPIKSAKEFIEAINSEQGVVGKKIGGGDGVSSSILYQLGTPIGDVKELEFFAQTYGDMEDVLAEDDDIGKTVMLIRKVAKPVGMVAMPSTVEERISFVDGMTIMTTVLPSFLQ